MILQKDNFKRTYKIGNFFSIPITEKEYFNLMNHPKLLGFIPKTVARDLSHVDLTECHKTLLKPFVKRILQLPSVKELKESEMLTEINRLKAILSIHEKQYNSLKQLKTICKIKTTN